jgi:hypothetical protein
VLLVSASGAWRTNLRGGAPVHVTIDGRERAGYAEVEEDPDAVARTFKLLLDELGPAQGRRLGLRANTDREPTVQEIEPAVARRGIARIRLIDATA